MPPQSKSLKETASELRQDPVSGDWVAIATARAKRPHAFVEKGRKRFSQPKSTCPFEELISQYTAAFTTSGQEASGNNWWVQVIPNKYPAFTPLEAFRMRDTLLSGVDNRRGNKLLTGFTRGMCAAPHTAGPYVWTEGVGFHEVVITRDHTRAIADMGHDEVEQVVHIYQERAREMQKDDCMKYVSIFHNHGSGAGATLSHPHSQIIALPVIPPDVARSIRGSADYFHRHNACVHCAIIGYELEAGERVIYENDHCVVVAPYASKTAFEMRIFPKKHRARFEEAVAEERASAADALRASLAKLSRGLKDPDYNFFFHTAPVAGSGENFNHYHWHIEIIPKTAIWAGFEIGTGIEISAIAPEDAASFLKNVSVP